MGEPLNRLVLCAIATALFLPACAGSSSSGSPAGTTPRATTLVVSPSSASFSGTSGQQATVSLSGATGLVSFAIADPTVARVSNSGGDVFVVTPIAGGTTTVAFRDSTGASTTFSISMSTCEPPSPTLDWVFPAYGSTAISVSTDAVWFGLYDTTNPIDSTIPDYYAYLTGSDGSEIQGQPLVAAASAPPAGATPPAPGYTYAYYTSAVSGLKAGVKYQVQLVDSKMQCLPPHVYGTFST